jgi:predicted amidohydrolase YtcJ
VTEFVWAHLIERCSDEKIETALDAAFEAYLAAGYTGIIDMAMDKRLWNALVAYRDKKGFPIHLAAHWFVPYIADATERQRRLDEAVEMHRQWHPSKARDFCVVGVKLISDGVVDGCTAALSRPYGGKTQLVHPIWPRQEMEDTVKEVISHDMQCAIHAIGDAAITQAIDAIEAANNPLGRHRIEHLETTNEEDARRLGKIGITASVQPIHSDPARLIGYSKFLGPEAWARAFPFQGFPQGNAPVAIGSDAPTASHLPLLNLYSATTRKSVTEPDYPGQMNPSGALSLIQAVTAATHGAAYSRFADTWVGSLKRGLQADFVVLETPWKAKALLGAKVWQTWSRGALVYEQK